MSDWYNAYDVLRTIKKILNEDVEYDNPNYSKLAKIKRVIIDFEKYEGEQI